MTQLLTKSRKSLFYIRLLLFISFKSVLNQKNTCSSILIICENQIQIFYIISLFIFFFLSHFLQDFERSCIVTKSLQNNMHNPEQTTINMNAFVPFLQTTETKNLVNENGEKVNKNRRT